MMLIALESVHVKAAQHFPTVLEMVGKSVLKNIKILFFSKILSLLRFYNIKFCALVEGYGSTSKGFGKRRQRIRHSNAENFGLL